ncbi:MAG: M13-type metalloendopeptidase [Lawsonella sp.]|nr:peptidase M13 [Mycobacteriales bacterium]
MTNSVKSTDRSSGLDFSGQDDSVRPADDLFHHVNGTWLKNHEIPADRPLDGAFVQLREESDERVRSIIEDAPQDSRIGAFYQSFMDTETLNKLGLAPLTEDVDRLRSARTHEELATHLGKLQRDGVGGLLGIFVDQDAKDPNRYVVYLSQSGLSLPDEAYYREERHAETLSEFEQHVSRMFELTELLPTVPLTENFTPESAAAAIVAFEKSIASHHLDAATNREAELRYNPTTLADIDATTDYNGYPITDWYRIVAAPHASNYAGTVVVRQPEFLKGATTVWGDSSTEDLAAWILWKIINARASMLTEEISKANFEFYGKKLSGTEKQRDRWKRGVALTGSVLGEDIGRVYVERHFPPAYKERITTLVDNLLEAYRVSIRQLEWMTPDTREKALAKLDKFTVKVGYPDKWRDYSEVELDAADLLGNYRTMVRFHNNYDWQKLGKPVDRSEWFMHPQTVNAYFNPVMNEIVFPAAILQPPFFDAEADDAANYGGIGAVIGHEIGHGFDDQGSKYDGNGRLNNWWTDADRDAFTARTKQLVDQYEKLTPTGLDPDVHHVNGQLTLGENIGDLGGLGIALLAYELALETQGIDDLADAPVLDGLTGLQRVFYNWATVWRTKIRKEQAITYLSIDPHSPAEFRCNQIVRNLPQFYEAFNVTPEDDMWLPEEERVAIWR